MGEWAGHSQPGILFRTRFGVESAYGGGKRMGKIHYQQVWMPAIDTAEEKEFLYG